MQLWAAHFDGALDQVFDLQDQVTSGVVGVIAPKIEKAEIERAKRKPTDSLDAYDYYLHGLASLYQDTKEANDEALRLFGKAIELDPNFATAYGMSALCYVSRLVEALDARSTKRGWRSSAPRRIARRNWAATMQWPCLPPEWRPESSCGTSIGPLSCLTDPCC